MRFIIILLFVLGSCSKPKSVLMCGNSICKNQKEAQEYFDKNFTLEVKVLGKNQDKSYDLVKINDNAIKTIKIKQKKNIKNSNPNLSAKITQNKKNEIKSSINNKKRQKKKLEVNKSKINEVVPQDVKIINKDVCKILPKCDIENVRSYLLKIGNKKKYPNISAR